jgi:hypothetical protein
MPKIKLETGEEKLFEQAVSFMWKSQSMKNEQQFNGTFFITNQRVEVIGGLGLSFKLEEIKSVSLKETKLNFLITKTYLSIILKEDKYGTGNKQEFLLKKPEEAKAIIERQMK